MTSSEIVDQLILMRDKAQSQVKTLSDGLERLRTNPTLSKIVKVRLPFYFDGVYKQKRLIDELLCAIDNLDVENAFNLFDKIESISEFIKEDAKTLFLGKLKITDENEIN